MKHSGFVALIGRPNVGKSTLLNHLLGQKISITSRKPQTTRHHILGIKTLENSQLIFVDTPGLHQKTLKALNRYMNRTATRMMVDADVVVFMIDGLSWREDDEWILAKLSELNMPIILAINKVDVIKTKEKLLPFIEILRTKHHFAKIVPISAKNNVNLTDLERVINQHLPKNEYFYDKEQITDRSERFLSAEIVREKLMRNLGQELPYSITVQIEQFKREAKILRIAALIFVERESQKAIIIGKSGAGLKRIGKQSRMDMEKMFNQKVFLQMWVRVKRGWSDDERGLKSLGYE